MALAVARSWSWTVKKSRPVLSYKGVNVYHSFKGGQPLTYWYAMVPNHRAEGGKDGGAFDVRALPKKYTSGLLVENKRKGTLVGNEFRFDFEAHRAEREAHMEAMRRAIDDGFALGQMMSSGKMVDGLFQSAHAVRALFGVLLPRFVRQLIASLLRSRP